ncbi:MAG: hypothetical protein PHW96_00655 [Candidatus Nanoarchaeia archaeon]|nr:hypothetical protein [Candidatus Nanoarchaeia archaeon]
MVPSYLQSINNKLSGVKEYVDERNKINKAVFHDNEYLRYLARISINAGFMGTMLTSYLSNTNNNALENSEILIGSLCGFMSVCLLRDICMAFGVAGKWEKQLKENKELSDKL